MLEELASNKPQNVHCYRDLIVHIEDRLGHDRQYALDSSKIQSELGWKSEEPLEKGLRKTVKWYLTQSKREDILE